MSAASDLLAGQADIAELRIAEIAQLLAPAPAPLLLDKPDKPADKPF